MNCPKNMWLTPLTLAVLAFGLASGVLTSCSVSTDGPAGPGASHGALASNNMCDYYYSKLAGYTYAFSNVENIYNADGSVTTLTGAPDTVRTLGQIGAAPNG